MSEIRVTSVVGENGGDRVGLTTGLTVGPLTGTTGIGATISHQGHAQFAGVCTSTSFVGNGVGLTNVSAGKVVGFAFASSSTNEQNTSGNTTWTLVGPQITYTAASTSNKLLFLHTHHMMVEDMTWHMALYRDGTSGTQVYQMQSYTQDAQWIPTVGITNVVATPPDTSSHTYQFAIYRNGGADGKIRYSPNNASTGSQITMLEIQP